MAVLELNALSTALSGSFSATVIFPDQPAMQNQTHPALYFLHDMGGNDTDIRTIKNLEALANKLGLFVICPSVMHSFGLDLPLGGKYGDFVSRELPGICRHMFPLDEHRQFVGGSGSGAYGAYWHAANHPYIFSKCMLINGRYDVAALCEAAANGAKIPRLTVPNLQAVFGDLKGVRGGIHDVLCPQNPVANDVFFGCTENFEAAGDSAAFAKQLKTSLCMGETEEAIFEAGLHWLCKERNQAL